MTAWPAALFPVGLAAAAAAGALAARPAPLAAVGATIALAALLPRPATVALAVLLLASTLGARAWAGLAPPPAASVDAWVTLVTDPAPRWGAVRAEARLDGRRVEVWARGPAAGRLAPRLAGERLRVRGLLRPLATAQRRRLAHRHLSARLSVSAIDGWADGAPVSNAANRYRRLLDAGAASLSRGDRSLFSGVVFGDDRMQDEATLAEFRASGLSHLLAVSGQNVAFVLAVAGPGLRRLPRRARLAATAVVLVAFGTVTRWEPSVLRAVAMAGLAVASSAAGRPVGAGRALALAVTALLLVDPLLVHALGFRLSVAACAGIAALARPLEARLRGPAWLREAAALTIAAQVGVAPVLLPVFGGVPLAALPANVAAAPVAALLMTWGLAAGTLAGLAGGSVASLLHLPTAACARTLAAVATTAARLPLGQIRSGHVVPLALAVAAAALARRVRR